MNSPDNLYIDKNLIKKMESFCYSGHTMEFDEAPNMDIKKRTYDCQRIIEMLNLI